MGSPPEPVWTVAAATGLEARAVRRALPGARVVQVGVGLSRLGRDGRLGGAVVACGLAGALVPDLVSSAPEPFDS